MYNKANYEANKESVRAKHKAYYEANKDKLQAYTKAYYEANKDKLRAKSKEWKATNKEKLAADRKAHYEANKEEQLAWHKMYRKRITTRYRHLKRSANRRDLTVDMSFEEYVALVQDKLCHYCCGALPETGHGLDRKDSSKHYTVDNCVPCCERCNKVFGDWFSYNEKLILGETIKDIECLRRLL